MKFQPGFLPVVTATWICALASFLSPAIIPAVLRAAGWDHPSIYVLFAPLLLWMLLCLVGISLYRAHSNWLLVSAPMALFTPIISSITLFSCLGRGTCR